MDVIDHAKKSAIAKELLLELAPDKAKSRLAMRGALVDLMDDSPDDRKLVCLVGKLPE